MMCTNRDFEMDAEGLGLTLRGLGQYYLSEGVGVLIDDLRALGVRLGPLQLPIRAVEYAKLAAQRSNERAKRMDADLDRISQELGRERWVFGSSCSRGAFLFRQILCVAVSLLSPSLFPSLSRFHPTLQQERGHEAQWRNANRGSPVDPS